jgi:hypothetical protein
MSTTSIKRIVSGFGVVVLALSMISCAETLTHHGTVFDPDHAKKQTTEVAPLRTEPGFVAANAPPGPSRAAEPDALRPSSMAGPPETIRCGPTSGRLPSFPR